MNEFIHGALKSHSCAAECGLRQTKMSSTVVLTVQSPR